MAIVLLLGGVALLVLPGLARRAGRLLVPREWVRLCVVALVTGAASFELGTLLLAVPTVLRALGIQALEAACERLAGPLAPTGGPGGWSAAALAVVFPILFIMGARKATRSCRRLWLEPWVGEHTSFAGLDLVVLPIDDVVAISISGTTQQVVVSRGLCSLLPPAQLAGVLRHEAAHLRFRHQRLLIFAVAIDRSFGFMPPVASSTYALRTALERWADESAAGAESESRRSLRQALLAVAQVRLDSAVCAFSCGGTVVERLSALERDPPRPSVLPHTLVYAPGLIVGVGLAMSVAGWAVETRVLALVSATCPI